MQKMVTGSEAVFRGKSWGGGSAVASSSLEFKKLTQKGQKEFRISDQKQNLAVCRSAPVWR
jgi:hypothetical protein